MTTAIIVASIIVGLCLVCAALIITSGVNGAAASLKESAPQSLQQPTLKFFTEFDAADYLGVSLNELDYLRSEGLLDGSFMAVTSLEQTGEEEYTDIEDGVQVVKVRPVMANVTRFLFNRELLDEKVCDMIRAGKHINPLKNRAKNAPKAGNKQGKGEKHDFKPENKPEAKPEPVVDITPKTEKPEKEEGADDIKEYIPKNNKNNNGGNNGNNGNNPKNNYGGKNNGGNGGNNGKNNNGGYNKGGQQKQNRPEQQANRPAFSDDTPADAPSDASPVFTPSEKPSDFPVAKQRIVPKPTITVISSKPNGDDDGMVDIMSSAKPKN